MSDSVSPCLIVYSPQPGEPAVTRRRDQQGRGDGAGQAEGASSGRAGRSARRIWVLSDMSVDTAVTGVTGVTCGAFVTPSWYYTGVIQRAGPPPGTLTPVIVVVGAGLAGLQTVVALRGQGYDGRLTLLGAEPDPPYDRPPLTKALLLGETDDTTLEADWAALDVDLRLGVRVSAVQRPRHDRRRRAGLRPLRAGHRRAAAPAARRGHHPAHQGRRARAARRPDARRPAGRRRCRLDRRRGGHRRGGPRACTSRSSRGSTGRSRVRCPPRSAAAPCPGGRASTCDWAPPSRRSSRTRCSSPAASGCPRTGSWSRSARAPTYRKDRT